MNNEIKNININCCICKGKTYQEMDSMDKNKDEEKPTDYYNYKHSLCSLYYFSTRLEHKQLEELFYYFTNVLQNLIKNAKEHKEDKLLHNYFLNNILNLISHTRSIEYGKGERDTSYMMLYCLYCSLPIICEKYFPFFINSGSWKDIKYLCEFVRTHAPLSSHDDNDDEPWGYEQHPMIKMCISYCLNVLDDTAVSTDEKRLILKWIPRENSAFDWVFQKMVVLWSEKHHPYILQTAKGAYSREASLRKCKMLFRQWKPTDKNTIITEPNITNEKTSNEKTSNEKTNTNMRRCRSDLDFPSIIKKAFELLHSKKFMDAQNTTNTESIDQQKLQENVKRLNREWIHICNSCGTLENFLPVLAIHYKIDDDNKEPFYNAVAVALLMCEKSTIQKRIMLCDEKGKEPIWINLESCIDLFSMICLLDDHFPMNVCSPKLEPALKLLFCANAKHAGSLRKNRIRLCIIGNSSLLETSGDDTKKDGQFQFIYWRIGDREGSHNLPQDTIGEKTYYMSGNSIACIDFFSHYCFDLSYHNLVLTMINNRPFSTPSFFI